MVDPLWLQTRYDNATARTLGQHPDITMKRTYNIDNLAIHWEPRDQGWVVFIDVWAR